MPITFQVLHGNRIPPPAPPFTQHGVALGPSGGAIVSVDRGEDKPRVIAARRFPPALAELGAAVESLLAADESCRVVVDAGLHGLDLWAHLGGRRRHRLRLFESTRPELRRFEIAGKLRSAVEAQAFVIERRAGIDAVLRKAIGDATREDAADRPELVALSLAVLSRKAVPRIW